MGQLTDRLAQTELSPRSSSRSEASPLRHSPGSPLRSPGTIPSGSDNDVVNDPGAYDMPCEPHCGVVEAEAEAEAEPETNCEPGT